MILRLPKNHHTIERIVSKESVHNVPIRPLLRSEYCMCINHVTLSHSTHYSFSLYSDFCPATALPPVMNQQNSHFHLYIHCDCTKVERNKIEKVGKHGPTHPFMLHFSSLSEDRIQVFSSIKA